MKRFDSSTNFPERAAAVEWHLDRKWDLSQKKRANDSSFFATRSYAALRAADLDWIVGPGHNWPGEGGQGRNKQKRDLLTHAGSQLTRGGGAGQE